MGMGEKALAIPALTAGLFFLRHFAGAKQRLGKQTGKGLFSNAVFAGEQRSVGQSPIKKITAKGEERIAPRRTILQ